MPLMPKRVKYRKVSKGSRAGYATSGTELAYGEFGLKALTRGLLTATQIEACRVAINREMKRKGKLWIRVFPDKPVTRKPIEVRMGGGKGNPEFWAAVILPGKVLFEVGGVSEEVAKDLMSTENTTRGARKVRKGVVVSKSGAKTVKVRVSYREIHPVYGKVVTRNKNYHVHDEADDAKVGDTVTIMETRPLSATKRWRIVK